MLGFESSESGVTAWRRSHLTLLTSDWLPQNVIRCWQFDDWHFTSLTEKEVFILTCVALHTVNVLILNTKRILTLECQDGCTLYEKHAVTLYLSHIVVTEYNAIALGWERVLLIERCSVRLCYYILYLYNSSTTPILRFYFKTILWSQGAGQPHTLFSFMVYIPWRSSGSSVPSFRCVSVLLSV